MKIMLGFDRPLVQVYFTRCIRGTMDVYQFPPFNFSEQEVNHVCSLLTNSVFSSRNTIGTSWVGEKFPLVLSGSVEKANEVPAHLAADLAGEILIRFGTLNAIEPSALGRGGLPIVGDAWAKASETGAKLYQRAAGSADNVKGRILFSEMSHHFKPWLYILSVSRENETLEAVRSFPNPLSLHF